ncbi:hypothetical protein D3C77_763530 [compost metagenome]
MTGSATASLRRPVHRMVGEIVIDRGAHGGMEDLAAKQLEQAEMAARAAERRGRRRYQKRSSTILKA